MRDPRLDAFETELRDRHPNLSEDSIDYFVRQRARRLELQDLEKANRND